MSKNYVCSVSSHQASCQDEMTADKCQLTLHQAPSFMEVTAHKGCTVAVFILKVKVPARSQCFECSLDESQENCFLQTTCILYVYSNIQVCFYEQRSMMCHFFEVSLSGSFVSRDHCSDKNKVTPRGVSYWNAQNVLYGNELSLHH